MAAGPCLSIHAHFNVSLDYCILGNNVHSGNAYIVPGYSESVLYSFVYCGLCNVYIDFDL